MPLRSIETDLLHSETEIEQYALSDDIWGAEVALDKHHFPSLVPDRFHL
jgi:hypothetical protein